MLVHMEWCSQAMGVFLESFSMWFTWDGLAWESWVPESWYSAKKGNECHEGDEEHNECNCCERNHDCSAAATDTMIEVNVPYGQVLVLFDQDEWSWARKWEWNRVEGHGKQ